MNEEASNNNSNITDDSTSQEYSYTQQIVNNLPYAAMGLLGAAIFVIGISNPVWGWLCASAYVIYILVGTFWIIMFLCPYCERHGTMCCPCGYGRIAARLRQKADVSLFREKFKKHILVIVPLWFIPVIAGVVFAIRSFSWLMVILLVLFAVVSFVILPLFSKRHSCTNCPQKDSCPWMGSEADEKKTQSEG
jgi:membrane protein YdbS with pleckstrin-like domain